MSRRHYINSATPTTTSASITSGATSFSVADLSTFPASFPYLICIDPGTATAEVVLVTGATGNTITACTRGYDGTSAQAHASSATVEHVATAIDYDEANAHVNATTGVHGVVGSLVGTSDTQTLTNKTLTSPTISGGQYTGASTLTATGLVSGGTLVGKRLISQINFENTIPYGTTNGAGQMTHGVVEFDTLGAVGSENSDTNNKVTIPAGQGGDFRIVGEVCSSLTTGTTGRIQIGVSKNDNNPTSFMYSGYGSPNGGNTSAYLPGRHFTLADGDVLRFWIKYLGGASGSLTTNSAANYFLVEKIG